ncbi:alpha/beta hydrolase [Paenibacillus gansuensis]|uniref:Alpha/beta hydrolase n=1 Tax=Paenibacillus gansuensis TaxID=306542 RepID=A0ABW5PAM8_9BACL
MAKACLLIHGFTGGPFEVRPLALHLEQLGYECYLTLLPGHGGSGEALRGVAWQEWLRHVEKEADKLTSLHGSFDLVGFSMGGLLAAYLARRYPVRRLVLLSAAVIYLSPGRFIQSIADLIRSGQARELRHVKRTPLEAVWQFTRLVKELKPELRHIRIPTLVLQGDRDEIVHPASARYISSKLRGYCESYHFPRSKHLICLDSEKEQVFERVADFLEKPLPDTQGRNPDE